MCNLKICGQVRHGGHRSEKDDEPADSSEHEVPVLEQEQRHDGMLCLGLGNGKQTRKQNHRSNEANDNGAVPCILNATP